jgi:hypothetical protein
MVVICSYECKCTLNPVTNSSLVTSHTHTSDNLLPGQGSEVEWLCVCVCLCLYFLVTVRTGKQGSFELAV